MPKDQQICRRINCSTRQLQHCEKEKPSVVMMSKYFFSVHQHLNYIFHRKHIFRWCWKMWKHFLKKINKSAERSTNLPKDQLFNLQLQHCKKEKPSVIRSWKYFFFVNQHLNYIFQSKTYFLLIGEESETFSEEDQQICRKINKSAEESTVEITNFNIVKKKNRQW